MSTYQPQHSLRKAAGRMLRGLKRRLHPPINPPLSLLPTPWQPLLPGPRTNDACPKLLVLSHMYPHPQQPFLGPFVHDQVKALRQYLNIDARVLVGRPYWLGGKNPMALWRQSQQYFQFHDTCAWFSLDGVPVKYLPYHVFGPFWTHGWAYRASLGRGIERLYEVFPFTIIHAHTAYLDGSAGLAIAQRYRVPFLITEHTNPFSFLTNHPIIKRWTRRSLHGAEKVIAVSVKQQRDVAMHMADPYRERVLVLPNGVDVELFRPPAMWRPDPRMPRILFVGHFAPYKNLPLLLEAFSLVVRTLPEARLCLIGGAESTRQESDLRHLVARKGLKEAVTFLGPQPHAVIARIMREETDLLVLSSQSETFGCVVTEALACGKPVVSTRSGGPEDIVTADFLGELCVNNHPEALARAIIKVATNIHTYAPRRIRRYVEERFSYQSLAQALDTIYHQVCEAA